VIRRVAVFALALGAAAGLWPAAAQAHGIVTRSDLPVPGWLFAWAAGLVLIISFAALAALWPEPKLQGEHGRPLPRTLGRVLTNPLLEAFAGAIGVFLIGLVVYSGLDGTQTVTANITPTFVYVVFWLGLVLLSIVFGDIFRAFNPWRAVGRAFAWVTSKAAGGDVPPPFEYPPWLGRWPAAVGLLAFASLELVVADGNKPQNLAIATLVYSALTWLAMALYGVESWTERGEAFSVYFNLFSRIAPLERRGRELWRRPPLSGLTSLEALPGTVAVVAVMIGSVTFDGAQEAALWTGVAPHLSDFFHSLGLARKYSLELAFEVGLLVAVLFVYSLYRLGVAGARSVGGGFTAERLAHTFIHSLVPIALAYVSAHYMTLLLFQGQALPALASDPLGRGSDLLGTAHWQIHYGVIGVKAIWYWQVGFVVAGHVSGLTLAHDRALAIYDEPKLGVRSQYWMLAVMVGFTSLALWLLSQSNV
jgi:predicted outer membrane lipoprotein